MALTSCRECGKQVSTDAKTCPNCGTPGPAIRRAPVVPKKASAWKKYSNIRLPVLLVFALGLGQIVMPHKDGAATFSAPPKTQVAQSKEESAKPQESAKPTPAVASDPDDPCYYRGKALGGVYMANFSKMSEVGLMATDFQHRGCAEAATEKNLGESCVRACEIGFKQEVRSALQ